MSEALARIQKFTDTQLIIKYFPYLNFVKAIFDKVADKIIAKEISNCPYSFSDIAYVYLTKVFYPANGERSSFDFEYTLYVEFTDGKRLDLIRSENRDEIIDVAQSIRQFLLNDLIPLPEVDLGIWDRDPLALPQPVWQRNLGFLITILLLLLIVLNYRDRFFSSILKTIHYYFS